MNSDEINRVCQGLISGLFKKAESINENEVTEIPDPIIPTPPIPPASPENAQINIQRISVQDDNSAKILTEIRDALKESNVENRDLAHATLILSYVAFVVALAALGENMWAGSGLPLLHLRAAVFVLIIGGTAGIYWDYKKKAGENAIIAQIIAFVCVIIGAIIFLIVISLMLTPQGLHPPNQTTGTITNIYENCTYPVINTVNNYNVTIVKNCTSPKCPIVSVAEMNHLMVKSR